MFAGHLGVALAAARVEPRVNIGVLAAAALWLDAVLWTLVLLGAESVVIPADFARTHQPHFVFPYSHGLLAAVLWSVLGAAAVGLSSKATADARKRAALVVAAVVFSHWILDALVHRPELPLAGGGVAHVGLGLWDAMPLALVVEAAFVAAGMVLFFTGSSPGRARNAVIAVLVLVVLAFTVAGMTVAPAPPSATAMAGTSLVTIALTCALMGWAGRKAA